VHVVLTEEPALLVANHGELVTAQIVIAFTRTDRAFHQGSGGSDRAQGNRIQIRSRDPWPPRHPTCGTPSAVPEATRAR
jgi:hypothetical protein